MRFTYSYDNNERLKIEKLKNGLLKEQKKLEDLVLETLEKGNCNMGSDIEILKQSGKVDKLVVDEMMLWDIKEKQSGE